MHLGAQQRPRVLRMQSSRRGLSLRGSFAGSFPSSAARDDRTRVRARYPEARDPHLSHFPCTVRAHTSCFSPCSRMLVIGIVMLFSTSAFAQDSHGDVYFFVKHQVVWLGVGLVVCIVRGAGRLPFLAAHLVDLVRPRRGDLGVLFRAAPRDATQWFAPLGRPGWIEISAFGIRQGRRHFLPRVLVFPLRESQRTHRARLSYSAGRDQHFARAHRDRSRSRDDRTHRRNFVCHDVCRRDQCPSCSVSSRCSASAEFFSLRWRCPNGWRG